MKPTKLFLLFLFLSLKGFSHTTITTTITTNVTIDQPWIIAHPIGPWEITTSSVTVTFGQDLVLNHASQFFEIKADNVTIDGANKIVTLNGINNYTGLISTLYDPREGYSSDNVLIKNIGVVNGLGLNASTLDEGGGYISGRSNKATITNCYSTGPISSENSGGIAGVFNGGDISNCYSRGAISGKRSGGITVYSMGSIISNCFSTGDISGEASGGIVGWETYSNIVNCYSSGDYLDITATAEFIAPATGTSPTPSNSGHSYGWDNNIANSYLTGEGTTVWNTSVFPYTLLIPVAAPTFGNTGAITLCQNGSYFLNPSTTDGTFSSTNPTIASVNASGYITGLSSGTSVISLVTSGGTVSATINVNSSASPTLLITDPSALASYKFNGNPQGPIGGTINYVGYNGFNYSSQTRPNNTGFYRASKQSGIESGCPYTFYIFRCTTCPD